MTNQKIVKVNFIDYGVEYGENPELVSYLLVNPNKDKLYILKEMVETRFDYKIDDTLSDEEIEKAEEFADFPWDKIDEFIKENFTVIDVDEYFEILW